MSPISIRVRELSPIPEGIEAGSSIERISRAAVRELESRSFSGIPLSQGPQILLAEDNPINQKIMKRHLISTLQLDENDVFIASNGREALDLASKRKFDLIITDWEMPPPDGIELTILLRSKKTGMGLNINTPIIAWTTKEDPKNHEEMIRSGMNGWLPKIISRKAIEAMGKQFLPDFFSEKNN